MTATVSCPCVCHAITSCYCDCWTTIEVPVKAVSTNQAYRKRGSGYGLFMTPEGKAYKQIIGYHALEAGVRFDGPVKLDIEFHYKDKRKRDVDGALKITQDALQGVCYDDDYQVFEVRIRKFHDGVDKVIIKIAKL